MDERTDEHDVEIDAVLQQPQDLKRESADDFIPHRKRGKFVAPEGATVAVRQNDGRVRVCSALGYMPTVTTLAQTKPGGNRRARRHQKKNKRS